MAGCLGALSVLYKSDNFIVVDKAFDVRINSNDPKHTVTVEHQLRAAFPEVVDPQVQHGFRFQHRLDHATSGALCVGLNKKAAAACCKCFEKHMVTKHYLAIVRGLLQPPDDGTTLTVDVAVGRDSRVEDHCKMCTADKSYCVEPRDARTSILVLQHGLYEGQPASKLLLIPHTGRTHQLRVHCKHLGHCIVGDFTYSDRQDVTPYRMMLHAHRLCIPVPSEPIEVAAPDIFLPETDNLWAPEHTFLTYKQFVEGETCTKTDKPQTSDDR